MIDYCRNCGANLEPGATRCRRCGAEVSDIPEEEPSFGDKLKDRLKRPGVRKLFLPLAALLVLLAIFCIAFALSSRWDSQSPAPVEDSADVFLSSLCTIPGLNLPLIPLKFFKLYKSAFTSVPELFPAPA